MHIHWFPGHMTKAKRMMEEQLKLVDVVIELLDARIPSSSSNPLLKDLAGKKPRVLVLTKADLAENENINNWISYYKQQGILAVAVDLNSGKGIKVFLQLVQSAVKEKMDRLIAKGLRPRAVRAMIAGIPNVGKSTLINRLKGTAVVKTGDKAGVTRGKQWIKVENDLELLDTPGVLWPKLDDQNVAFKLAVTGAMNDDVYDTQEVVLRLIDYLSLYYPGRLIERYRLAPELFEQYESHEGELLQKAYKVLQQIAQKRGCLRSGGVIDEEKTLRIVLTDYRSGKLGRITLDQIPEEQQI